MQVKREMFTLHRRAVSSVGVVLFTLALLASVVLPAGASIPWNSDFEAPDYAPGDSLTNKTVNGVTWYASSNTVVVVSNQSYSATNAAYVPTAESITNSMSEQTNQAVWIDVQTIPEVMDYSASVAVDLTASSLFYFSTDGYPVVQWGSTTNWMMISNNIKGGVSSQVSTGAWNRITVYRNYSTKQWALFINGELIRDDLPFVNQSASGHSRLAVRNETYLDNVAVMPQIYTNSFYTNLTGDIDSDGMTDGWEIHYFGDITSQDGDTDFDNDGRSNVQEFDDDTNPTKAQQYPQGMPYREDFNDATNAVLTAGQWWHGITNSGTAQVQSSTTLEGSHALSISNGTLALVVSNGATNVWVQMYTKPVFYDDDLGSSRPTDPNSSQVAAFYIKTGGVFAAYSDSGWTDLTSGSMPAAPSNTWLGIATHLDYEFDCWDIYVSTSGVFGDVMKKVNTSPLLFNAGATPTHFTNLMITAEEETFLDVLAVSLGYETNNASYTNLLAVDRIAGKPGQSISMPPYYYNTNDALLAHKVGDDMKRSLTQGDKLTVNNTNGPNIYSLEVDGSALEWNVDLAGSMIPSNVLISLGISMTLDRDAGADVVVFYPYTNFPAFTNEYIFGTNDISVGWTQLRSPYPGTRSINGVGSLGMGFSGGALQGDRIYTATDILIYNGTQWRHMITAATNQFMLDDPFWYYHKGTGYWWTATP